MNSLLPISGPVPRASSRREHWYVAETIPRKEALAIEHLRRQEFHGFCPRLRKSRRHARKCEQVLVPLFPSYVFVRVDVARQPWRSINGTLGIRRLVGADGAPPQPMPDAAMSAILARCEDGVVTRLLDDPHVGQKVRVVDGPFRDSVAAIETLDDRGRVAVLLEILGRPTRARLSIDNLAPI